MDQDNMMFDDGMDEQDLSLNRDVDGLPKAMEEDTREIYILCDFLENELVNAPVRPIIGTRVVDVDKCLDILHDIRANLPEAIQYANQTLVDRERILRNSEKTASNKVKAANARADAAIAQADEQASFTVEEAQRQADAIISEARERAEALVSKSEILRRAQEEATHVVNDAKADARDRQLEVSNYVRNLLNGLESDLVQSVDAVRQSRKNLGVDR